MKTYMHNHDKKLRTVTAGDTKGFIRQTREEVLELEDNI